MTSQKKSTHSDTRERARESERERARGKNRRRTPAGMREDATLHSDGSIGSYGEGVPISSGSRNSSGGVVLAVTAAVAFAVAVAVVH